MTEVSSAPRDRILWPFLLAGFASLLVAAHYDSIRGPLLPPVARELHLEFGDSGWFLAVCHVAATLMTGLMIAALNRWPERLVTAATGLIGCLCAAMATQVHGFPSLLILALLVGSTISTMGAMSNVLVLEGSPPRLQGRMLAGLHAMYGLGSMAASWVVGESLRQGLHWPWIYAFGVPGLVGLTVFALVYMRKGDGAEVVSLHSPHMNAFQLLIVALIAVYVAGEANTSIWLSSYLVSVEHFGEADAATATTVYFGVLTLTRIACFLWINPQRERPVLMASLGIPLLAFAIGYWGRVPQAFLVMGVFGAFFPVFLARVSRLFPLQWRAITIWSMTAMQVTIGFGEWLLGQGADLFGMRPAFLLPAVLLIAALGLLLAYFHNEHRKVLPGSERH